MKITEAITSGFSRSLKSWKGVVIIWFSSLLLVSTIVIPLKGALRSVFGKSMITEKLSAGFTIEVFTDLGDALKSLISSFSSGFLFIILVWILLNAFMTGGLFHTLRRSSERFSSSEFFMASARNFWSFLIITFIISIIIFFLGIFIILIPVLIVAGSVTQSEVSVFNVLFFSGSLFLLFVLILLLVADYARAWQVINDKSSGFRAIGFRFRQTFRTFLSSYSLIILLIIIQVIFVYLVFDVLSGLKPSSEGRVFQLFLLSQLLFYLKTLLKAWRYASVTCMMEQGLQKGGTDYTNY